MFTTLPMEDIAAIEKQHLEDPSLRIAQAKKSFAPNQK
jgi:hypothetical protein